MLRITVTDRPTSLTFRLEGKLAGPWVRELEQCWQSTQGWQNTPSSQGKPVLRFDLTGVTFIDAAGKQFLTARHAEGAEFVCAGCLTHAIVAEITGANRRHAPATKTDNQPREKTT